MFVTAGVKRLSFWGLSPFEHDVTLPPPGVKHLSLVAVTPVLYVYLSLPAVKHLSLGGFHPVSWCIFVTA